MLFYNNLDQIIFNRHNIIECDELYIISGYLGPHPVTQLKELPIKSKVVYGMYGEQGISRTLHNTLVDIHSKYTNVDIFYSTIPVHAKCYIWRNKGEVRSALVGSANFSTSGLTTPYKEILAETTIDTFHPLNTYIKYIEQNLLSCMNTIISNNQKTIIHMNDEVEPDLSQNKEKLSLWRDVCPTPLYILNNGIKEVPKNSGLNWGMAKLNGAHVNIDDAYIKISSDMIYKYPKLFPAKQIMPTKNVVRKGHRHNDCIEIIWDDGTNMIGLLEGSIPKKINGISLLFPKQISTSPSKSLLGKYIRARIGIDSGTMITMQHLQNYGRDTIDISLLGDGIYYFDFSNK